MSTGIQTGGYNPYLLQIIAREKKNLDIDCCYSIRFAMKESPELRLAIEKRWEKVMIDLKMIILLS